MTARLVAAYPEDYVWLMLGEDPAICPALRNDAVLVPRRQPVCGRPVAYIVTMRPGRSQWVQSVGVCAEHTIVVRAQDAGIITEVRTA